jgi:ubiquinone/menaquinone biosynthesis C-methylase UbiE
MSEHPLNKRSYATSARLYDPVIEPLVGRLRIAGLALYPPRKGISVLDVGCGTGMHLSLYKRVGCKTFGIDLSPAMLSVARGRLDRLTLGDGSRMPYPDQSFDLVTTMLMFHEMPPALRAPVLSDAKRVTKESGRLLIVDYHPGPVVHPEGWVYKAIIIAMENLAGREHSRSYRSFMTSGGLAPLIAQSGLLIDKKRIVGGGTMGLYLLRPG